MRTPRRRTTPEQMEAARLIGSRLRLAMDEKGWNLELFARKAREAGAEMKRSTVHGYMQAERSITAEDLLILARVTGKPISWFYDEKTPDEQRMYERFLREVQEFLQRRGTDRLTGLRQQLEAENDQDGEDRRAG